MEKFGFMVDNNDIVLYKKQVYCGMCKFVIL